jgi:protein-disulfide isomerase
MTEHHINNNEIPEILIENKQESSSGWSGGFLPASIILAAIIIAGSSLYNTRAILRVLGSGGSNFKGITQIEGTGQAAPPAPSAQAPTAPLDPSQPIKVPDRADAPLIGNKNAKVTLYEFSDFQCPYCKKFFDETFGQIKTKYIDTGKVKLVFRNYPLPFHQNAQKAAEAGECANRQGKFREYHDLLFKNSQADGTGLAAADLKKYADSLGLNNGTLGFGKNKFNTCLDNNEAADAVKKDMTDAGTIGVSGTPSFVINGNKIIGAQPFANFEQAIESALKK